MFDVSTSYTIDNSRRNSKQKFVIIKFMIIKITFPNLLQGSLSLSCYYFLQCKLNYPQFFEHEFGIVVTDGKGRPYETRPQSSKMVPS